MLFRRDVQLPLRATAELDAASRHRRGDWRSLLQLQALPSAGLRIRRCFVGEKLDDVRAPVAGNVGVLSGDYGR